MSLERAPGKLPAGHWGLGGPTGLGGGAGCWRGVVASLGCCSSLPGDTCLSDIPRGVTGGGAEPRGAEGAQQRVAQPGWHSVPGRKARAWQLEWLPDPVGHPWGASAGMCLGSWQGAGRAHTLCFKEPLPLPGVFLLGPQESGDPRSWEAKGTGAVPAATPWEGAIGVGKVTMALPGTEQGERNLMTKEGSRVGLPCPRPVQLAVSLSSVWPSPTGTLSHHQAPRLLAAPGCPWESLAVAAVPLG